MRKINGEGAVIVKNLTIFRKRFHETAFYPLHVLDRLCYTFIRVDMAISCTI